MSRDTAAPVDVRTLDALRAQVTARPLPAHVGIIMDGNGRWAERRGLSRLSGHREGSESVRAVTREARRTGVRWLTLYAFSMQNWERPADEVGGLMELLAGYLERERTELLDNDIRLEAVGALERLPVRVRRALERLREDTAGGREMTLTLALSYGGREELVQAARALVTAAERGELSAADVDEAALRARLWTGQMPDPDLVVRTSGEQRLSNFLLFQAAYAEVVFSKAAWPDFRGRELLEAIFEYQGRERRFGRTGAQLREQTPRVAQMG